MSAEAQLDTEQTLLASLRTDLLNEFDSGVLVFDDEIIHRRSELHAEHALDAALARGVHLHAVLALLGAPAEDDGTHDHEFLSDIYAGTKKEQPFPEEFERLTLGALKRGIALHGLAALASAMCVIGSTAVLEESTRRISEAGLPTATPIVEVLPFEEWRELYAQAISVPLDTLVSYDPREHEEEA